MKYLVLAYYLSSYSMGFVTATLVFLRWHRTREPALRSLLLFIGAFSFFNLNYDSAFLLNTVLGLSVVTTSLFFLGTSAVFFSWFNLGIADFTHQTTLWRPQKCRWLVMVLGGSPILIFAVETFRYAMGWSTTEARVNELGSFEVVTMGFQLYNTALFFVRRNDVVELFLRSMVRFILGLNLVFFPLFVGEFFLNFYLLKDFRPVTLTNSYFFIASIGTAILLFRHYFSTKPQAETTDDALPEWTTEIALSDREKEIVDLLALGLSNKEIAAKLFIETSTVKNHLYRVYQRTGSHSRVELLNKLRSPSS